MQLFCLFCDHLNEEVVLGERPDVFFTVCHYPGETVLWNGSLLGHSSYPTVKVENAQVFRNSSGNKTLCLTQILNKHFDQVYSSCQAIRVLIRTQIS